MGDDPSTTRDERDKVRSPARTVPKVTEQSLTGSPLLEVFQKTLEIPGAAMFKIVAWRTIHAPSKRSGGWSPTTPHGNTPGANGARMESSTKCQLK
jgi:hypothetical protein